LARSTELRTCPAASVAALGSYQSFALIENVPVLAEFSKN
jgi:hypothetical protein